MKISIDQKLRPFSHTPGSMCALPGTDLIVEAFPTLIRIGNLQIPLSFGPVQEFTLQQDLEKNCVWVFSKQFRAQIFAQSDGITFLLNKEKQFFPIHLAFFLPAHWERLSLGKNKSQDWDLVWRRFDLEEILPILYGLGQKIPPLPAQSLSGTAHLLHFSSPLEGLEILCRAAFHKILVPRLRDDQLQGYCPDEEPQGNPFFLLQETTRLIRALFFRQEENQIHLLPNSPFLAGRMIHIQAPGIGSFDLEWTKGRPRRALFYSITTGEIFFHLQKEIRSFRARSNLREKGRKHTHALSVEAGKTYFLDNFHV